MNQNRGNCQNCNFQLFEGHIVRLLMTKVVLIAFIAIISCSKNGETSNSEIESLSHYNKIEIPESYVKLGEKIYSFHDEEFSKERIKILLSPDGRDYVNVGLKGLEPNGKVSGKIGDLQFDEKQFKLEKLTEKNIDIVYLYNLTSNFSDKKLTISISYFALSLGSTKFSISGEDATVSGTIGSDIYNQILDLNKDHPEVTNIIFDDMPGSVADDINLKTGYLIREAGYSTEALANSYIASGGVDLFLSGKERIINFQWESDEYGFFVHGWCCTDSGEEPSELPQDAEVHRQYIEYSNDMLGVGTGRDFYFFTLEAAPSSEIHRMTDKEIRRFGLNTQ